MIKKHKKSRVPLMRRSVRIFLNDLNAGKTRHLLTFLRECHDVSQYFIDLFWQHRDFSATLADIQTIHRGRDRFAITTRLAQALAKQAKETLRAQRERSRQRKPRLRRHTVTLYSHFVTITPFQQSGFDYAITLIGSGAPRLTIPCHATRPLNRFLEQGWTLSTSIRLGRRGDRLFVDLLIEKPRPVKKTTGTIVGMDSNYKNGFVFSDGQQVGKEQYDLIRSFAKRQKHTYQRIQDLIGQAMKRVDFSGIKTLCIENLKHVKRRTRGTFSRLMNRRLSHWQYAYTVTLVERYCEQHGVRLEWKDPYKTSQYCRVCGTWDRRNRKGDIFHCVWCGQTDHADVNAAQNLSFLGLAGVYGLRWLPNKNVCSQ